MEDFVIEIAGVPVRIRCRYPQRGFFADYLSGREPQFTVEPTDSNLADMDRRLRRKDPVSWPEPTLENLAIHALLAEEMVMHGVLLLHGSALCMDGQAVIFIARSGIGKSTHARYWRERFGDRVWMINDDKPMIRTDDLHVCGTPWDGKHHLSRNASAPLKALVWLRRDTTDHIEPITAAEAFPVLVRCAYHSDDPARMARITALEQRLLGAVRFYRLGCTLDPEAAGIAHAGIFGTDA